MQVTARKRIYTALFTVTACAVLLATEQTAQAVDLPESETGYGCVVDYGGQTYISFDWYDYSSVMYEGSNNYEMIYSTVYQKLTSTSTWTVYSTISTTMDNRFARDPNPCQTVEDPVGWYAYSVPTTTNAYYATVVYFPIATTTFFYVVDDGEIYANNTQVPTTSCDTCTHVTPITPGIEEVTLSYSFPVDMSFYVNSNDVENENSVYVAFSYASVKAFTVAQSELTNYSGKIEQPILWTDEERQFQAYVTDVSATGTYNGTAQVYEKIYPPWWKFWDDSYQTKMLDEVKYQFYIYTPTDAEEIAKLYEQIEREAVAHSLECDFTDYSASCIKQKIEGITNGIIYAPPWGYASKIVSMLMSTTTATSTIAITHTFPTGSPGEGQAITLNLSTAVESAIEQLDTADIATIEGSPFAKFMEYWNTIWYIILALWIVREILGTFSFDLEVNPGAGNYKRSGVIPVKRVGKRRNELRITSYD